MGQTRTAKEIMAAEAMGVSVSTGTLEGDAQAESATIKPEVVPSPRAISGVHTLMPTQR